MLIVQRVCPESRVLVGVLGEVDVLQSFDEVYGELIVDGEEVEGCGEAKFLIPVVVCLEEFDVAAEGPHTVVVVLLVMGGVRYDCEVRGLVDGGDDEGLCVVCGVDGVVSGADQSEFYTSGPACGICRGCGWR